MKNKLYEPRALDAGDCGRKDAKNNVAAISSTVVILLHANPAIFASLLTLSVNSKDLLTRRWYRVGDKTAREKAGQALRDAIKTRRASQRKRQRDSDGNYHDPSGQGEAHQPFSHVAHDSSSASSGDEDAASNSKCVKRARKLEEATPHQEYRPTGTIPSTNGIHSSSAIECSKSSDQVLLHNAPSERILASNFNTICNTNQNGGPIDSHVIASIKHFESQLSSELEPRPISSVAQQARCDNRNFPHFRNLSQQMTEKGGEWSREESQPSAARVGGSMSIEEQKPRLLARQTRSEESAFDLLRHLLQPEYVCQGNDIMSINDFFVSKIRNSPHLDELGVFYVAEDGPIQGLRQGGDMANSSSSFLDRIASFDSRTNTGAVVACSTDARPPEKYYYDTPRPLLQRPEQHMLPTMFGSEQFSKLGRGNGSAQCSTEYWRKFYFPEIAKSSSPALTSLPHPDSQNIDTMRVSKLEAGANQQLHSDTSDEYQW